jgi:hypothetical protein
LCREIDHVANAEFVHGFTVFCEAPWRRSGAITFGASTLLGRLSEAQGLQSRGLFLQLITLGLIFRTGVRILGSTLQLPVFGFGSDPFRGID